MEQEKHKELLEDLSRNLPYFHPRSRMVDADRIVRVTANMSEITHEMIVRHIYDRVRDPETRQYLAKLPMNSEELEPVKDAMLASLDFILQWRFGCEYTRRTNVLYVVVPDAMPDSEIPGYIEDLEGFVKETFKTIGVETRCESFLMKK